MTINLQIPMVGVSLEFFGFFLAVLGGYAVYRLAKLAISIYTGAS